MPAGLEVESENIEGKPPEGGRYIRLNELLSLPESLPSNRKLMSLIDHPCKLIVGEELHGLNAGDEESGRA